MELKNEQYYEDLDELIAELVDSAYVVHKEFGPGLLESAYETCLCLELADRGIQFERQKNLDIHFKNQIIQNAYRIDLIVENKVIVEIKASNDMVPIFTSQLLTYMKLTKCEFGLLINFNTKLLKAGIKRYTLKGQLE